MRKLSTKEFIQRASEFHQNKFDYSLTDYKDQRTPLIIICPLHGEFKQTANSHLKPNSYGCMKCYLEHEDWHRPVSVLDNHWRFQSKYVKDESGCWLWVGSLTSQKYGSFWCDNKTWFAHRYSYEKCYGKIPKNLIICHKCDIPRCVNPEHLFLGTQRDNILDMYKKGRGAKIRNFKKRNIESAVNHD